MQGYYSHLELQTRNQAASFSMTKMGPQFSVGSRSCGLVIIVVAQSLWISDTCSQSTGDTAQGFLCGPQLSMWSQKLEKNISKQLPF